MERNIFQIINDCFDYAYANRNFKSQHICLYLYLVYKSNRLHWNHVFGLPTDITIHVLSMGYKTYKKCLMELESIGAIKILEFSSNQHASMVIELNNCFGLASVKKPKHDQGKSKARPKHDQHNKTINTINTNKEYIYKKECFDFYKNFYFEKFKSLYIESCSENENLQSLLDQLDKFRISVNDKRELVEFFQDFIKNVWNLQHDFYCNHFTLSVLNKKFNDIINQLRNNKGNKNSKSPLTYIRPTFYNSNDVPN
jgi:hypothetical protein